MWAELDCAQHKRLPSGSPWGSRGSGQCHPTNYKYNLAAASVIHNASTLVTITFLHKFKVILESQYQFVQLQLLGWIALSEGMWGTTESVYSGVILLVRLE